MGSRSPSGCPSCRRAPTRTPATWTSSATSWAISSSTDGRPAGAAPTGPDRHRRQPSQRDRHDAPAGERARLAAASPSPLCVGRPRRRQRRRAAGRVGAPARAALPAPQGHRARARARRGDRGPARRARRAHPARRRTVADGAARHRGPQRAATRDARNRDGRGPAEGRHRRGGAAREVVRRREITRVRERRARPRGARPRPAVRIVLVNWQDRTNPLAGGAEVHLHEIFGRLAARHEVHLLCCGYRGASKTDTIDGIHVHRVSSRYGFALLGKGAFAELAGALRPDVVVEDVNKVPLGLPSIWKGPFVLLVPHLFGTTAFRELPAPLALMVWAKERSMPRVYARAAVHAISPSTADELLARGFRAEAVRVIYPGVDTVRLA